MAGKFEANLARYEHGRAQILQRMTAANGLALSGLRGLTIINGGAIIALFTLLAQGARSEIVQRFDAGLIIYASASFVTGLCLNLACFLLAFHGEQRLIAHDQNESRALFERLQGLDSEPPAPTEAEDGYRLIFLAAFLAGLSLLAFVVGAAIAVVATLAAR